jgi:predicted transcriptional regulator
MVTLTINLDDDMMTRLKEEARQRGTTVDALIAIGAELVLDAAHDEIELTEDEMKKVAEADAEIDRGEFVTHDDVMKKLRALRG